MNKGQPWTPNPRPGPARRYWEEDPSPHEDNRPRRENDERTPQDRAEPETHSYFNSAPQREGKDPEPAARPILIVDDDEAICELLSEFLESLGFCAVTARTGTEALQRVREHRPSLIITDVAMPEMDGTELCDRLAGQPDTAGIRRIMMSAWQTRLSRYAATSDRAHAYLPKPFDLDTLERLIFRLVPTKSNLPPI